MGFSRDKVNRVLSQHWEEIGRNLDVAIEYLVNEEDNEDDGVISREEEEKENKIEKMKRIDSNLMGVSFKRRNSRESLDGSYTSTEFVCLSGK